MLKAGLAVLCTMAALAAQDAVQTTQASRFYKLDFDVKELESGKVLSSHVYSLFAATEKTESSSVRTGLKLPVATGAGGFNFYDVGVSIDCRLIKVTQNEISLLVSAEVSTLPSDEARPAPPPTVRQNRWNSWVVAPLKRPTTIFSSDDLTTKRQMRLELTATPVGQ